jgi:hypothetical protein
MPKSYTDVTLSGAASVEVQEEGRKLTTLTSPGLAPQLSPNSNTNFGRASLDLFSLFHQGEASPLKGSTRPLVKLSPEVRNWASIYMGRKHGRVKDLPLFPAPKPTPTVL